MRDGYPNYKIPSRTYFSETVIPEMYSDIKSHVGSVLENVDCVSCTSDEWTSTCAKFGVISLTASFLSSDFKKRSVTICSQKISGAANTKNVCKSLDEVFEEWKHVNFRRKIFACTTDEGSVMKSVFRELDFPRRNCILNRLHNTVFQEIFSR